MTDILEAPTLAPSVRDDVARQGYATLSGGAFDLSGDHAEALRAEWGAMDPDPHFGGDPEKAWRTRRYSDFDFDPAARRILGRRSHAAYYQSRRQNAYAGGIERHFGDVTDATVANPLFNALVAWDFDQWPIDAAYLDRTWVCQVHQIRIHVTAGHTTPVTPEGVHSDGYPFAGVHLIDRAGVTGGQSTVYTRDAEPLASLTFETPLDTLVFEDREMKHYVTPITNPGQGIAHRDILAISFSLPDSPYATDV
ncbi:MAG: 2OG-Fe dioxygenase family protein [Azospirillaceae bacterium]